MNNRPVLEFDYYISPDGQVYQFNSHRDKFIYGVRGYGMPPIEYITSQGPFQHGVTLENYFLQPRIVQLMHRRNAHSRQSYWDARNDIINMLRPNRQAVNNLTTGVLRKVLPDGTKRDLNVLIYDGPRFDPRLGGSWDEWSVDDPIRFYAFDPTFYDPTELSYSWLSSEVDELDWPEDFPIYFDSGYLTESKTVQYTGTWQAYPTFVITGPLTGVVITNESTGETIEVNYALAAGDTMTITLQYGNKTITNGDGDNLIGTATTDSDIATFHIAPDPEVADGENVIEVRGSGATYQQTQIVMTFNTRYIGI